MKEEKDLNSYRPIIGMEIHVQLKTASKMFSPAANNPDITEPNTNIDEIVTAQPGTLPVVNAEAVRLGVLAGLALNCEIPSVSKFDRKHYFYPDLPKGYQISQYDEPIAQKGYVDITLPDGREKRIRITRAHLEEDAGKNTHPEGLSYSLVDYNRAGCPLLEIVTEPDLESGEEVKIFLQELRNIVRYVGASSADMEKGTMRCEPNISVRKPGEETLPKYKVEVKNVNSFKFVEQAINYEIARQTEMLEKGEMPRQVTMGWNEKTNQTVEQRSKEEANDYRYFPDPDLPILHFTKEYLDGLRAQIPELPHQKRMRFAREYGLGDADIENLISYRELNYFFEGLVSELEAWNEAEGGKLDLPKLIKAAVNWCLQDFSAYLNSTHQNPEDTAVTAENLAELIKLIDQGVISNSAAKQVFKVMVETGGEPDNIVKDLGLAQESDEGVISDVVVKVIAENAKAVADYKAGGQKAFGFLVGTVMKELKGKGNPQTINELLKKHLS